MLFLSRQNFDLVIEFLLSQIKLINRIQVNLFITEYLWFDLLCSSGEQRQKNTNYLVLGSYFIHGRHM